MRRLSVVLLVAVAVAGCKKNEPAQQQPASQDAAAPGAPGAQAPGEITGKVVERIDAPPYSYLRLQTAKGEVWTAVEKTDVANGAEVAVKGASEMRNFESKTLNRKFESVFFGTLGGGNEAAAAPAGMGANGSPPVNMAAQHAAAAAGPADVGDVKVEKASGSDSRTVSEVYSQRSALKEKPVTIRGKVVKFNADIMGKNWVHLRDGSGKPDAKDNDLTITTSDTAAVGDVIVVKGTVRVEKDFGAGYKYPVIVEDAKLSKK
jgi:hypothetical protein